jgi:hypothetical protein
MRLPAFADETDELLREVHHSVRNNFQIVASMVRHLNRLLPPERRAEMRLLEEHVQSMAAVYRVAEPRGVMRVSVNRLVAEVVDNLRNIAGCAREAIELTVPEADNAIVQQHAVALALFLAIVLPPYLDGAASSNLTMVVMVTAGPGDMMTVAVATGHKPVMLNPLRRQLADVYARQLSATSEPGGGGLLLRFPLTG